MPAATIAPSRHAMTIAGRAPHAETTGAAMTYPVGFYLAHDSWVLPARPLRTAWLPGLTLCEGSGNRPEPRSAPGWETRMRVHPALRPQAHQGHVAQPRRRWTERGTFHSPSHSVGGGMRRHTHGCPRSTHRDHSAGQLGSGCAPSGRRWLSRRAGRHLPCQQRARRPDPVRPAQLASGDSGARGHGTVFEDLESTPVIAAWLRRPAPVTGRGSS